MKKLLTLRLIIVFLCQFLSLSLAIAHEAPKTTEAKQKYIQNYLQLFEIEAKIINTYGDEKKPAVRYAIKNIGSEALTEIKVVIYFLDENGNPFLEKAGFPVSEYSFDLKILKPNYTYRMDKGNYNVFDNLGDEWSGKVKIEIVDIEFAE